MLSLCVFFFGLFVILVISRFGLEGWILVRFASVPGLCILFTSVSQRRKQQKCAVSEVSIGDWTSSRLSILMVLYIKFWKFWVFRLSEKMVMTSSIMLPVRSRVQGQGYHDLPERTETDRNGPKRTFVDTETDFLGTETDFSVYRN